MWEDYSNPTIVRESIMSKKVRKSVVYQIAGLMMGHYENPMESPWEFLDELEDEAQYIDDLLEEHSNMYHKDLKSFREEIMLEVAKSMKVKIKIL